MGFTVNAYGGALGQVFANYDATAPCAPDYVPVTWAINLYDMNDLRVSAFFQSFTTRIQPRAYMAAADKILRQRIVHQLQHPARQHAESAPPVGTVPHPCRSIRATRPARLRQVGSDISVTAHGTLCLPMAAPLPKENAMDVIEQERVKELYMEGFRLHDLETLAQRDLNARRQDQSLSNGSSLKVEKDDPLFVWPIPSTSWMHRARK